MGPILLSFFPYLSVSPSQCLLLSQEISREKRARDSFQRRIIIRLEILHAIFIKAARVIFAQPEMFNLHLAALCTLPPGSPLHVQAQTQTAAQSETEEIALIKAAN